MSIPRLERLWLMLGGAMLVAFLVVLLASALAMGNAPPSSMASVDPASVLIKGDYGSPGISHAGKTYHVHIAALTFAFVPNAITVPVGSKVIFHIAAKDVVHGFEIAGTDVNTMVIPGYQSEVTHTFSHKGRYLIVCNEYCGSGHHLMFATLIVA